MAHEDVHVQVQNIVPAPIPVTVTETTQTPVAITVTEPAPTPVAVTVTDPAQTPVAVTVTQPTTNVIDVVINSPTNAGQLVGATLSSVVVNSSLTSVGTLTGLTVSSNIVDHTKSLGAGAGYYFESRSGPGSGYSSWYRSGNVTHLYNSTSGTSIISASSTGVTVSGGVFSMNNATSNIVDFGAVGVGAPTFTTRSSGTKIVLYNDLGASSVDYAIGIEGSTQWVSVPSTSGQFKWYAGTTNVATLTGNGTLTVRGFGQILLSSTDPTITFSDTDHRTGYIHTNSNLMYFLGGPANAGYADWTTTPLYLNLSNNYATFGGGASFAGAVTLAFNGAVIGAAAGNYRTRIYAGSGWADRYIELGDYYSASGGGGMWTGGNLHIGAGGTVRIRGGSGDPTTTAVAIDGSANLSTPGQLRADSQVFARAALYTGGVGGNYQQAQVRAEESIAAAGGQCAISFHCPGNSVAPQLRAYGPFGNRLDVIDAFNTGMGSFGAAAFTVFSSERVKEDIQSASDKSLLELAKRVKGSRFRNKNRPQVIETTERFRDVNKRWIKSGRNPLKPTENHLTGKACDHVCGEGYCDGTPEHPCCTIANDTHRYGLIAEELFEVMPEAVNLGEDGLPESYNVDQVAAMALATTAALVRKIEELTARIALLENV